MAKLNSVLLNLCPNSKQFNVEKERKNGIFSVKFFETFVVLKIYTVFQKLLKNNWKDFYETLLYNKTFEILSFYSIDFLGSFVLYFKATLSDKPNQKLFSILLSYLTFTYFQLVTFIISILFQTKTHLYNYDY